MPDSWTWAQALAGFLAGCLVGTTGAFLAWIGRLRRANDELIREVDRQLAARRTQFECGDKHKGEFRAIIRQLRAILEKHGIEDPTKFDPGNPFPQTPERPSRTGDGAGELRTEGGPVKGGE